MASCGLLVAAPPHLLHSPQGQPAQLGAKALLLQPCLGRNRMFQKQMLVHGTSPYSAIQGWSKKANGFIVKARSGRNVKTARETVVPDPDYRIPIVLLGAAAALVYADDLLPAAPIGLLGLLLLFQTTRVRFVFDDEALEVKIGEQLQESGENVFVGGKNRWKYSTFVNWELWWPSFPILVYFKETQTKPEGQVHFFPVIFNGKQLYDVMVERAGSSQNSAPK